MTVPSLEELDSFKYSDLQNLAKSLGLRANLRADKLLRALKAHLKNEARKENENQDEIQTSASSCDEIEVQLSSQEQAEREPVGHVTKTRRRRRTVRRSPDSQESNLCHVCLPVVPSLYYSQMHVLMTFGNEGPKIPSERKKSLYTNGFSKRGKNKRTASTTPNFKKLHEARFKEMESIDQYVERKKKHFEEHNSFNELKKQPGTKGVAATPVPPRERLSVACTPASQRGSQGRPHAGRSTLCAKGLAKRSALSATKMNVRFSAATKDNEHKRSLTKTPARKSPHVTTSGSTPKGQAVLGTHKLKTTRAESAAVITPFILTTEAAQTPISHRKPVFDLKASLSRPLNYEPHKEPNVYLSLLREEQRKKHEQERKEKKAKVLGVRRGLIMAEHS
eukprot:bmy_09162T0